MIDFTSLEARRAEMVGAVILILVVLSFTIWYMATHQAPEPFNPNPVAEPAVEAVPPQMLEEHGQYFDIEASYPGETPLKASAGVEADAAAIALMEDFIEETARDFKRQGNFENLTPEDIQILGLSETRKESLTISYEEIRSDVTVSYSYVIHLDTLGAHPNTFYRTFTFDLATGDELEIKDLFAAGSGYLARLSAIAEFELSKSLGEFANLEYIRQGVAADAVNFQNYVIDGDALVLIFPPYQVAPYAAGTQSVSIPLSQLAEILQPEYQP